jgi:hypothetical protein
VALKLSTLGKAKFLLGGRRSFKPNMAPFCCTAQ